MEDPFNQLTTKAYEEAELGTNIHDYNSEGTPFLKIMMVCLQEIQKQLDAIQEGNLLLNGVCDQRVVCPDWRDSSSEDYMLGSTIGDDCDDSSCTDAAHCYDNSPWTCSPERDFLNEDCKADSLSCDGCYPYSRCGTGGIDDLPFIESKTFGSELAECATTNASFDHKSGICAYNDEILTEECKAFLFCKPCFPFSRCGEAAEEPDDNEASDPSATIVLQILAMVLVVESLVFLF